MQILSQRPDVPFRRGTEKRLKERKTEHDRLKKTNLIGSAPNRSQQDQFGIAFERRSQ